MLPAAFAHANERNRNRGRRDVGSKLSPKDTAFSEAFYAEFLASLGRSLEWRPAETAAESAAFRRDLEMYERWNNRTPARPRVHTPGPADDKSKVDPAHYPPNVYGVPIPDIPREGPFADRCALLLDPAMMEQARRAASEFEVEIGRAAARMFAQLGRRPAVAKHPVRRAQSRPRSPIHTNRRKSTAFSRAEKSRRTRKQTPHPSRRRLRAKRIARPSRARKSPRKKAPIRRGATPRKNRREPRRKPRSRK
jgi:hypothetical protein